MVYSGVINHGKLYPRWQSKPDLLPHSSATFFIYTICLNYIHTNRSSFLQDQHFRPLLWQSKPDLLPRLQRHLLFLHDLFELYPHKWSIQRLSPMVNYIHGGNLNSTFDLTPMPPSLCTRFVCKNLFSSRIS